MSKEQIVDPKRRYLPCLEGIRGYGFLLVFCGHYILPDRLAHPGTLRFELLVSICSFGLFTVPAFFVLSGYLIGGILYHTRNREGFFRVFYSRRFLRVFPVYYVTLLAIAAFDALHHIPTGFHFWAHFLYIQNLLFGYTTHPYEQVTMTHFWSLAVEEQFYLLWPLVVWRFRDKRKLIGISTALIALCWIYRLAAPAFSISIRDLSDTTLARVDAVLMGVVLNLVSGTRFVRSFTPVAKWVTIAGGITMAALTIAKGELWGMSYGGKEILIPLANFTAVALLIAVLEEGSLLNRICSQQWICRVGSLSYSLYIFHYTYCRFFMEDVNNQLALYVGPHFAYLIAAALGLCTTFLLSLLSYRFIERPMMELKRHLPYGKAKEPLLDPARLRDSVLAEPVT